MYTPENAVPWRIQQTWRTHNWQEAANRNRSRRPQTRNTLQRPHTHNPVHPIADQIPNLESLPSLVPGLRRALRQDASDLCVPPAHPLSLRRLLSSLLRPLHHKQFVCLRALLSASGVRACVLATRVEQGPRLWSIMFLDAVCASHHYVQHHRMFGSRTSCTMYLILCSTSLPRSLQTTSPFPPSKVITTSFTRPLPPSSLWSRRSRVWRQPLPRHGTGRQTSGSQIKARAATDMCWEHAPPFRREFRPATQTQ